VQQNTLNKVMKNSVTKVSEAYSNIDWSDTPSCIENTFTRKQLECYKKTLEEAAKDKESPDYWCWYFAANYTLLIEDDEEKLVEYTPEYRIDSGYVKLYKCGEIQVVLNLKHSIEEIWASYQLNELLQEVNNG
jgi:hypothetical protein